MSDLNMLRALATESMRRNLSLTVMLTALLLASGCVYQAALSQGNLLDQEDVDQLEVGMTRGQVRFLLGTPMIDDPFHDNRWDYVYFLRIGRDKAIFKRWVSVYFEGENVSEVIKDQELRPDL
jgi:outer membrane protein assembly factor BamE